MQIRLTLYFFCILLFVFGMYTLQICVRGFRRTRGTGTFNPHLYVFGIVLSAGLIVLAVMGVLFAFFGRLH
jgi:hypothetical protein